MWSPCGFPYPVTIGDSGQKGNKSLATEHQPQNTPGASLAHCTDHCRKTAHGKSFNRPGVGSRPIAGFDISSLLVIGYWLLVAGADPPPGGGVVIGYWLLVIGGYWPADPPPGSVIGYWWPRYWSARRAGLHVDGPQGRQEARRADG